MDRFPGTRGFAFAIGALFLGCIATCVGCGQTEYEIHLRPDGHDIQRTLRVRNNVAPADEDEKTSPLDAEELARLHAIYDPTNDKIEEDAHTFSGHFRDVMPADIGGAGHYTHLESPLGSASYYSERFRGEDDLVQSMQHREDAVDKIITLLDHWASSEISDPALLERVQKFLEKELRRDLKNVALYCWTHAMLSDLDEKKTMERLLARVMQYTVERNYLSFADVPRVLRIANSTSNQQQLELLREVLLRKLDCEHEDALLILTDPERFATSLRESIRQTDIYREAFEQHKREKNLSETEAELQDSFDPNGLLAAYAFQATLPNMTGPSVTVRVVLHCDEPPLSTNATWDDEEKTATWTSAIDSVNVPAFVFAGWSVPNHETQTERFGHVLLSGEPLAEWVIWYQGLDADERQQFDTFLGDLKPEEDLTAQIETFEFSDEQDETLGERGKTMLRSALEKSQSK